ncbi:MAG: hypothetical protein VB032_04675 [Burkholderiaceae bacterium]|nr:hypothetical protein [Burkholderiaceae bacterium]
MKKILAVGIALLLGGCAATSDAPQAINFPPAMQHKALAAAHWSLIANDVAEHLKNSIGRDNPVLYVTEPQPTDFSQAFHNLLISALVNKGFNVAKTRDGSTLSIEVNVQLVRFSAQRFQNSGFDSAKPLSGSLLAVNGVVPRTDAEGVDSLAKSALVDWNDGRYLSRLAGGITPSHELIVTISATNSTQYLSRRTNVYYILDSDKHLYDRPESNNKSVKNITITGDQ